MGKDGVLAGSGAPLEAIARQGGVERPRKRLGKVLDRKMSPAMATQAGEFEDGGMKISDANAKGSNVALPATAAKFESEASAANIIPRAAKHPTPTRNARSAAAKVPGSGRMPKNAIPTPISRPTAMKAVQVVEARRSAIYSQGAGAFPARASRFPPHAGLRS